ncbi:MAG TPA: hypothetical protein VGP80_02595 [Gemmatimonadales bacterium]|jgi:hypothetical protein|nr:hypothetical protein [Gemmatimonadales bacterium]
MRLIALVTRGAVVLGLALSAFATACVVPVSVLCAQAPTVARRPNVHLPEEAAGIDAIVRALVGAYDQVDIVALGEAHERRIDSDVRIALVRHPDFAKKVRSIVIECGSVSEQSTLDRYIRGENVPRAQLERVWKATAETTNGFCDAPIYPDFLAAVRDVNSMLPAAARLRVLAGHPGPGENHGIESTAVGVLRRQVLEQHGKVLLIFGSAHFYLDGPADYYESMGGDIGLARRLNVDLPGRTLTVIPIGDLPRPPAVKADTPPDYSKFDRALRSPMRPVLVSLQRLPFRDFTAEEFLGRTLTTCRRSGGCQSVFMGSTLTLGQMADATIYVGGGDRASTQAIPH